MGWLFHNRPLQGETPAQYLARHFTEDGVCTKAEVLDAVQVRGAVYMAIRNTNKTTTASYVFAAVVLVKNNRRDGFGYKAMDEGMGPCETACPVRIMKLLSPIEKMPNPGHAADWRVRVAAHRAEAAAAGKAVAALAPGDVLQTCRKLRYVGVEVDTFELVRTPPRLRGPIFRPVGYQFLCRIPRDEIVRARSVPP